MGNVVYGGTTPTEETDNWWEANKRQEKLIRLTNRLINRAGVVDGSTWHYK